MRDSPCLEYQRLRLEKRLLELRLQRELKLRLQQQLELEPL